MARFIDTLRMAIESDIFNDIEVTHLIRGTADRRYGLVRRALAAGDLLSLKRGLYAFGRRLQRHSPHLFAVAHHLHGSSHTSLESALAHHGWIPEATYTVTSVSSRRTASYETPLGPFSYTHSPRFNYLGVERVRDSSATYLLATPSKALIDYVSVHKVDDASLGSLCESLRIDAASIAEFSLELLERIAMMQGGRRLAAFARNARKERSF